MGLAPSETVEEQVAAWGPAADWFRLGVSEEPVGSSAGAWAPGRGRRAIVILSVAGGKGGTGKTTVAVNLALALSPWEKGETLSADLGAEVVIRMPYDPGITRAVVKGLTPIEDGAERGLRS